MSARRGSIEAEIERVSGAVLAPVRWVVLLGIIASIRLHFGLDINRTAVLAAAALYALLVAGLPRLLRRPFSLYAIERLLLAADLLFSAAVFHYSGGIRSPYFGLWYLALIHAGLLLGPRAGLGIAAGAAALVVASELTQPGGREALLDVNLALGKLTFLPLIAFSAGRLAQEVRDREAARRQAERRVLTLEAEERRVREEMEIARRVQQSLLPMAAPAHPGLTLATLSYPAREVGGDVYDLIKLPDGRLLVAVADVCGKGVPAALLAVAVQQGIRQFAGPEPAAVLAGVNRLLLDNIPEEMFVTAACAVIDPGDGTASAAVAGHPPPLWWETGAQRLTPIGARGLPLGLLPDWSGRTERWRLTPGDALILYTDGVLDAKITEHERLGEERLTDLLGQAPPRDAQDWVERLAQTLEACIECPDDLTVVAIGCEPMRARMAAGAAERRGR
jgi:serine phosphatase RsbU (regulator of sigma subunit)